MSIHITPTSRDVTFHINVRVPLPLPRMRLPTPDPFLVRLLISVFAVFGLLVACTVLSLHGVEAPETYPSPRSDAEEVLRPCFDTHPQDQLLAPDRFQPLPPHICIR